MSKMLSMFMVGIAVATLGLFFKTVLPNSEDQFLEIKNKKTNVNGTSFLIETPVSPNQSRIEMEGIVYIYYVNSAFLKKDCQITAELFNIEDTNSLVSCTTGEKSCDIDFDYKRKNKKLVLKFEGQPIRPLKLIMYSESLDESDTKNMCNQKISEIMLKPKWKRLSPWQRAFSR